MKRVISTYFLILSSFLCFQFSFAQQYNFKNYTVKNGLASSYVNNIFQDSKGYLWLGTMGGGLSRFDGKNFKNFSKKEGLVYNDVNFIAEDKAGNIWIATLDGVSKFNGLEFVNYGEKEGLAKGGVYWIYIDDENKIWLAVRGGGVNVFDGKKFTSYTTKDGLPTDDVYSIVQDKEGSYWFGLGDGIAKLQGDKIISYNDNELLNNQAFFSSFTDSKNNLWFGSTSGSIIKYNGQKFQKIDLTPEVKDDFIGSITEDKKGNIWFATDHGVVKYEGNQSVLFTEKEGLSSNGVLSVGCDYEGNIWIGTQGGGLNFFNNEAFVNYNTKEGLTNKNINCVITENNTILVGTFGTGINSYNTNTKTFASLNGVEELNQQVINTIAVDKNSNLWVGTDDGIYVLQRSGEKYLLKNKYISVDSQAVKSITKIICDKNGTIWCSSYASGVFVFKNGEQKNISKKNGLASDDIFTIFEDSKSNIWIGTRDAGVIKYEGETFTNYTEKEGLVDKSIWAIAEDENGRMYFGTGENGVVLYDNSQFKSFNSSNGLLSNYVTALQFDSFDKAIWLGTAKGINKLKINAQSEVESIRSYTEQEGFKGNEVSPNAIFIDKEGFVWFGSTNGLSRYNRRYDIPNLTPPKIHISGIRMGYQVVDWSKTSEIDSITKLPINLELPHKSNNLTFDFRAFTTDYVKYSFMLEGQDDEWSPLTTNTEAVFTNISPGKTYVFKLKAVNSNGVWSKETIEFSFTINPPWWATWWFYTLTIFTLLVSVIGFVNYRTANLAKDKRKLEEKVEERTVELKDANSKLSLAFQDIKDSINYAKKIQNAILPLDEEIEKALPKSFVLFKPRDVVSGDFYWFNKKNNLIYIAAVDCTGHGVPGAFMSMIGNSLLNEIVNKNERIDAASILKQLHQEVRKSLKQDRDTNESKDGMDLALTVIDAAANTLQYAGAKRSLLYFRDNVMEEIKADKQSIGGVEIENNQFTNHIIQLQKGDAFYMFTDGYVDQFGGDKGKKYSSKRLKETLQSLQQLPIKEQGKKLDTIIDEWKLGIEQIDDILVIGYQI